MVATRVGTATFAFTASDRGTFSYALSGVAQTKCITRQVYTSPATVCRRAPDIRNGDYKLLAADFNEYTLSIDFDLRQYAIRGAGGTVASGTFGDAVDGTYTFDIPGQSGTRNNARFRTAENLVVGSTLTFNAEGSVTWFDAGAPVKLWLVRSVELIVVRAQSYSPAATGNRRFQLALQDARSAPPPCTRAASPTARGARPPPARRRSRAWRRRPTERPTTSRACS